MPRPPAEPGSPPDRPRRAGRPRHDGREVVGDPTTEILAAAARLFGEIGLAGTTMSRLAAEVGLKQSSLYYYFRNRDEVVAALVAQANLVPLALIDDIVADGGSVGASLYRFVVGDVEALCALPFDINEIHRLAARDRDRFERYWKERGRLVRRLGGLIRRGVEAGELRPVDHRLTALTIMSNDEGVQNWYRTGPGRGARAAAVALAELTVAGLLADPSALDRVTREVAGA